MSLGTYLALGLLLLACSSHLVLLRVLASYKYSILASC